MTLLTENSDLFPHSQMKTQYQSGHSMKAYSKAVKSYRKYTGKDYFVYPEFEKWASNFGIYCCIVEMPDYYTSSIQTDEVTFMTRNRKEWFEARDDMVESVLDIIEEQISKGSEYDLIKASDYIIQALDAVANGKKYSTKIKKAIKLLSGLC